MATPGDAFDYESAGDAAPLSLLGGDVAPQSLPSGDGAGSATLVVRLPRGCSGKQPLLAEYVRQLRLPDYFGWNWDALEECLRDLSWLTSGQAVTIWHAGLPLRGRSRRTYLDLLDEVVRHWRESKQRKVRVIFPRILATKVEGILRVEASAP